MRTPSRQSMPGMELTPWGEQLPDARATGGAFSGHMQQQLTASDACQQGILA